MVSMQNTGGLPCTFPKGTTDALALELFEPALEAALRPSPDYDVAPLALRPQPYSEYRYILGTRGRSP